MVGVGAVVLARGGRPNYVRVTGGLAALSMLPLYVLGLSPSAFSIAALVALPGLAIAFVSMGWPRVLMHRAVQGYVALCIVAATSSTLLEAWWLSRCVDLKVVIPDEFAGEFRMVQDHRGLQLRQVTGSLVASASGEIRVSDAPSALRCYSIEFRSPSGEKRDAEDIGTIAGPLAAGKASTEADGTVHQWHV
jgi:hypothetical protein